MPEYIYSPESEMEMYDEMDAPPGISKGPAGELPCDPDGVKYSFHDQDLPEREVSR